jgi:uncharacterized protein (DUF1786 family)
MKILTVDIGTGTQDIFMFDSRVDIENGFKLVMPSPTMQVHKRIRRATARGEALCLTGVTMGGGPSHWAVEAHLDASLPVFATPDAARSFNDDLDFIAETGIQIISADEAAKLPDAVARLTLHDFDFQAIANAFAHFEVPLDDLEAVAVAVFDHGAAPPDVSDRKFRFDYLDERIQAVNQLSAFAYLAENVPRRMTRLQAVVDSAAGLNTRLVVMDTAPAAVLGVTFEAQVSTRPRSLIVNIGNFHTLAFRLGNGEIEGVFEHHTGLLDQARLEDLLLKLADGTLTRQEVFADSGHGALIYGQEPLSIPEHGWGVAVTGPRRAMLAGSILRPHFPAPFGDMMLTGCFGLLSATADLLPELREPILASLQGSGGRGTPPWEIQGG